MIRHFFIFFAESVYFGHKAKRMNLEQFAQQLRILIAQGETNQAIDRLLEVYNQTKGEYYDELIVIASHYKMLRDKTLAGALEDDEAAVQNNAINHSLLQLIDQLDEDKPLRRHFRLDDSKLPDLPDFKSKPKSSNRNLFIGIGFGVLLIAGFFLVKQLTGNPEQQTSDQTEQPVNPPVVEDQPAQTERTTKPTQPKRNDPAPPPPREEKQAQPEEPKTPPAENNIDVEDTTPEPASLDAEPNNSIAEALALTLPADQTGTIGSADDRDHYKISLEAGQKVDLLLQTADAGLNPILEVLDARGNSLQRLGARDGKVTTFHRAQSTGDYYLRVYGRLRSTGNYRLRVRVE